MTDSRQQQPSFHSAAPCAGEGSQIADSAQSTSAPSAEGHATAPRPMIYFGATCKRLAEQLADYDTGSLCIPHAQADADAITRLYVRGYISQAVKDKAQDRLGREIVRAMKTPRAMAAASSGDTKEKSNG